MNDVARRHRQLPSAAGIDGAQVIGKDALIDVFEVLRKCIDETKRLRYRKISVDENGKGDRMLDEIGAEDLVPPVEDVGGPACDTSS